MTSLQLLQLTERGRSFFSSGRRKTLLLATGIIVAVGTAAYIQSQSRVRRPIGTSHSNGPGYDNESDVENNNNNNNNNIVIKKSRQTKGLKSLQVLAAILLSHMGRLGARDLLALLATVALKLRSSVLDNDIVSGVLLRIIRQKANLLSQRDKKELGYPFLPLKVTEEPQKKCAFQMRAPEDFFEMDDNDDDGIHDNGHVLLPLMENSKPETSAADIIKTPTLLEVSKAPELVEYKSDVSKITERVELKAEAESGTSTPTTDSGFLGGSVSEPGLGFKIPITSSSVTITQASEIPQSTLQMEKISPVSPFSFSANQLSEFKPNADSDSKEIKSVSSPVAAASTTAAGSGLFGFSSSATATSTVTAAGSGLFGISSPAIASSTTTGSGLFGFSSSAVATSTTTGSGLFGFSSPAAAISTTGSGLFGFSSPAATAATSTTISTTTGSSLFGFSSPAAATLTTTTGSGLFGFSSPASAISATTTTGSALFGFSSSAAAATATTSQSQGSFFDNFSNGFQSSSTSSTLFGSAGPAFGSSSSFGVASETKSCNSTSIFGSTWQQPQKSSGFGSFQSSGVKFNAISGSFFLGSGGEKSNRRINKDRKK